MGISDKRKLNKNWPILHSTKCLLILSHYPYFNVFREVLETIYRTSLSSSSLPIERYIQNIVSEVPLPPLGRVDVCFAIADTTITIWRPPRNQLPMIDFSLRPLFMLLSVENILVIFSAMCAESKICFCSSNIALLTPVIESFHSFLFPFVWQGAYIPVLPFYLTDILEAPVPFVVGIHGKYLLDTPHEHRPDGVIFVDLDTNRVSIGQNSLHPKLVVAPLPERAIVKLKAKLTEFGGCIQRHGLNSSSELRNAGNSFPNNEHLLPIEKFAVDVGLVYHHHSVDLSTVSEKDEGHEAYRCFVHSSFSGPDSQSILDPTNNNPDSSSISSSDAALVVDTGAAVSPGKYFNGREIRAAFLRFFVKILQLYPDYVKRPDSLLSQSISKRVSVNSSVKSALMSFRMNTDKLKDLRSSFGSQDPLGSSIHSTVSSSFDESAIAFDSARFLRDHPDKFYSNLCVT